MTVESGASATQGSRAAGSPLIARVAASLAANVLAAAVMAGYFWLRHPTMQMRP